MPADRALIRSADLQVLVIGAAGGVGSIAPRQRL